MSCPTPGTLEATLMLPRPLHKLHSKFAQSFITNVQLDNSSMVISILIDSGASGTFMSNQLDLLHHILDKPPELQLFDRSPTSTGITQYYDTTFTLDNKLRFQVQLFITQLLESTPIMLELPWLQNINPNINWKDLIMQFPGPEASLAATIPLCLQSPLTFNIPNLNFSNSRATQTPPTLKDNKGRKAHLCPGLP
ncbi:hypothetical protein C0989_004556 [Termitomyces sp. Mn162]|nr:hypothetical protein C0989_004556 [Termitomyces sp. Mn162]